MKFFTPELFAELNSDDDNTVDRAEENWQKALRAYQRHLKRIGDRLPVSLRRFSEQYCLHDASVLSPSERNSDFLPLLLSRPNHPDSTSAVIPVKSKGSLLVLWYFDTSERPHLEKHVDTSVFYDDQVIWLYDEIDCLGDRRFSHEILFSNGVVAKLIFREFLLVEQPDFRVSMSGRPRGKAKVRAKAS
jgi:hypothetical protein